MIENQPIGEFLQDLASSAPTPGGGSAAAIMGAMGASLVAMVCNLTIGKKDHEAVEGQMREVLEEAEALRVNLTSMIADDVAAFDGLMAAYKLPRASDEDKLARSAAIQAALRAATDVPLACAAACAEVIELARRIAATGNRGVISDAGVAVLAAQAGLRSAALNVDINLPSVKDADFAASRRARSEALLARCGAVVEDVLGTVRGRL